LSQHTLVHVDSDLLSVLSSHLTSMHAYKVKHQTDHVIQVLQTVDSLYQKLTDVYEDVSNYSLYEPMHLYMRKTLVWLLSLLTGFLDMTSSTSPDRLITTVSFGGIDSPSVETYQPIVVEVLKVIRNFLQLDVLRQSSLAHTLVFTNTTKHSIWNMISLMIQQYLPLIPRLESMDPRTPLGTSEDMTCIVFGITSCLFQWIHQCPFMYERIEMYKDIHDLVW
jgi:hypothetical protein